MGNLLDDPALAGVIVVAGVAQDDHGALGADLPARTLPERLEGVPVVAVPIHPDHVGLGVDPVDGLHDVVGALEQVGHLVDAVDEHKRTDAAELARQGIDQVQGEAGEGRHRPGDVGDHEDLRLVGARRAELRVGGYAAGAERVADRRAEVQGASPAATPLAGQAHGQLAGQRVDRLAQQLQLVAAGMHEVDVLGQWLAQRARHRLDAPVGHQSPADLRLDLALQRVDAMLVLVGLQPRIEAVLILGGGLPGRLEQLGQHTVEVELAQRAIQVIGAADRSAGLHAGVTSHRLAGDRPHLGFVALQQRLVQRLGQLLGGHRLAPGPPCALLTLAGGHLHLVLELGQRSRSVLIEDVGGAAVAEVHLEDGLEHPPVAVRLHQRGRQGVLERVAVLERDVPNRLHRVEIFGEAHRQPRFPQGTDEATEQVEERLAGDGEGFSGHD